MLLYAASVLGSLALEPLAWAAVPLASGLLVQRWMPRLANALRWLALAALLVCGWLWPGEILLANLELRYPQVADDQVAQYDGVIVLGGALAHSDIWLAHHRIALNHQASRMTEAVSLMRKNPRLRLLFTGGFASMGPDGLTEAQRAKIFFDAMGVDASRVRYESESSTTYENALLGAAVPGVDKRQRWLLLTSAFHMPRAMGVFRKMGWNVTPFPVDYRSSPGAHWSDFSLRDGPPLWRLTMHEIVGYWFYSLAGWT